MTTIDTVTEKQLCCLREEAMAHGDYEQVALCNQALAELARPWEGTEALDECVVVINNAEANADTAPMCQWDRGAPSARY